ncbi:MAG: hypothetical protein AAF799_32935 [Myxococcota bacterium]
MAALSIVSGWQLGCQSPPPAESGDGTYQPRASDDHPFVSGIEGVVTSNEEPDGSSNPSQEPVFVDATGVRSTAVTTLPGLSFEIEATPEVSDEMLEYLVANLGVLPGDASTRKDLLPFLEADGRLQKGFPEVRLPQIRDGQGMPRFFTWPDAWDIIRPGVIRLRPELAEATPSPGGGNEVGSTTAALTGSWTTVEGRILCGTGNGLPFAPIEVSGVGGVTDGVGNFSVAGTFTDVDVVQITYDGTVTNAGVTSPLTVMDDFHQPRGGEADVTDATATTVGDTLQTGTLTVDTLDCELYELGFDALSEYHTLMGASPPAGNYRMKRWDGVEHVFGTPYAYHDYAVFPINFRDRTGRRATMFHEFAHTVRHAADGDLGHWGWDNFRWTYARARGGNEVFNEQYAFNEGWSQYWECTRTGAAGICPAIDGANPGAVPAPPLGDVDAFADWNELQLGRRLMTLSSAPGVGHATMVSILIANPGVIHTLWEFEQRYCATVPMPNPDCDPTTRRPLRTKNSCPPGFDDHGATCWQQDVVAKDSYPRHGDIPTACEPGATNHAGLCHGPCPAGFDAVGFHCWQDCPPGMTDDGAFCRRDVDIRNATNRCPWWDACGLFENCTTCPDGYQNDGCTCRLDAWIFAKETRDRAVTFPGCDGGREYDGGLCYDPCRAGFTALGSVCWAACPPGFDDHGATCYRPPNILTKF